MGSGHYGGEVSYSHRAELLLQKGDDPQSCPSSQKRGRSLWSPSLSPQEGHSRTRSRQVSLVGSSSKKVMEHMLSPRSRSTTEIAWLHTQRSATSSSSILLSHRSGLKHYDSLRSRPEHPPSGPFWRTSLTVIRESARQSRNGRERTFDRSSCFPVEKAGRSGVRLGSGERGRAMFAGRPKGGRVFSAHAATITMAVDTHKNAHVAVALDGLGRRQGTLNIPAKPGRLQETRGLGKRIRSCRAYLSRRHRLLRRWSGSVARTLRT